ncbi:MAG: phospho-N-acetylmuramoyl-pentapeptide-transferase [Verrucomicrobiae bacterium]|nr:phospho-N-acetylmuramoyl-pentapeptide-transferase [Verrucomicrobiae bacterium]
MLELLHRWSEEFGGLNVFRYTTFRALGSVTTSALFCLLLGPWFIRKLTELKIGQPIRTRDEVNRLAELHGGKRGTPTMGGVMILCSVVLSCLLWAPLGNKFVILAVFTLLVLGGLGFADDYLKVTKKKSDGISARAKLSVQLFVGLTVGGCLIMDPSTHEQACSLQVPFLKAPLVDNLGWIALAFFALVLVGSSNAVNLTDGLDGLAAGCTVIVASVLGVFSYVSGTPKLANYLLLPITPGTQELAVFCGAVVGATMGFLWYNCHPAKVFMGDTGSLALGGAMGTVAICVNQELLLLVAGGIFVVEALSVMLQVVSFKTRGKRIFAMAPLHHHFELMGWSETAVVVRFWILGIFFAALALLTLKLR